MTPRGSIRVPRKFITNHLNVDWFTHLKPDIANKRFINPWLKFTHPVKSIRFQHYVTRIYRLLQRWVYARMKMNLPQSGLGIRGRCTIGGTCCRVVRVRRWRGARLLRSRLAGRGTANGGTSRWRSGTLLLVVVLERHGCVFDR